MLAIAPQEASAIVSGADGLPPLFYRSFCDTEDRKVHYLACRSAFQTLKRHLEAYFTGSVDPETPNDLRVPFALWRNYYISLYSVIRQGWRSLAEVAQADGLPLPQTPGELLVQIIADECDEFFAIAFPKSVTGLDFLSFSPQAEYRFVSDSLSLKRHKEGFDDPKFQKRVKERQHWLNFAARREFVLAVCNRSAKGDRLLRDALKSFHKAQSQWESELIGFLHPSRKGRGFSWVKGVLNKT